MLTAFRFTRCSVITSLTICACAAINRLRGWGPVKEWRERERLKTDSPHYNWHYYDIPLSVVPKWRRWVDWTKSRIVCSLLFGATIGLYALDPWIAAISAAGFMFWAVWPWGDYWSFNREPNDDVSLIDDIMNELMPDGWRKDLLSMTLRGLLGYPLFIALAFYLHSFAPLLIGLGMGLQGLVYIAFRHQLGKYIGEGWGHIAAEWVMGAVIAALVVVSL